MTDTPRILVTRKLPQAVEARAAETYAATLNPADGAYGPDGLVAAAEGMDGLLVAPTDRVDAALIGRLPDSVKIVATFSVGYEHIDLEAARARGLVVTNTPDVLTDATADMAVLLMLAAARRAHEGQTLLRAGKWAGWTPTQLMGIQVTGKRVGIVGMGRIGQAFAKRARAFDMAVHYYNRRRLDPALEQGAVYHDTVEGLLPQADFLSLHCPLTAETHHLMNGDRLALLPDGAVLVNTARGPVVDDDALIAALASGKLAAAGLDVFQGEPDVDPRYWALDNVFILPHQGSATVETRNAMGFRALDNLDAFFAGKEPGDRVA
ncbi:MAG: D-glycerate dehydrogenase [Rhodobacterales bacterium]|nr:D-glycerate dehydrogenase [Rhodobacterales bacterium]